MHIKTILSIEQDTCPQPNKEVLRIYMREQVRKYESEKNNLLGDIDVLENMIEKKSALLKQTEEEIQKLGKLIAGTEEELCRLENKTNHSKIPMTQLSSVFLR